MRHKAVKQTEKPREPYVEIEQRDVDEFVWGVRDPEDRFYGLYDPWSFASSLERAERAGAKALRRYLEKKGVAGRKWTLTLEEPS